MLIIDFTFFSGNLSSESFNERESAQNYADMCETVLKEEYPDTIINVSYQFTSGYNGEGVYVSSDEDYDFGTSEGHINFEKHLKEAEYIKENVRTLTHDVWSNFQWFVEERI